MQTTVKLIITATALSALIACGNTNNAPASATAPRTKPIPLTSAAAAPSPTAPLTHDQQVFVEGACWGISAAVRNPDIHDFPTLVNVAWRLFVANQPPPPPSTPPAPVPVPAPATPPSAPATNAVLETPATAAGAAAATTNAVK